MNSEVTKSLRFEPGENESFTFDTGVLSGVLRHEGESIGLVPVTHIESGTELSTGTGMFNHYRVFTRGKRYGYGARRWPSAAELRADGSVVVYWASTDDRPFELRGTYRWTAPNTIDLVTEVRAVTRLYDFEVFLASYFCPEFTDSRVWAEQDPRGGDAAGFVSADRELGEWLAFPRDESAVAVIEDGRWDLEPHPLAWTTMPKFNRPLAVRRDPRSGLTTVSMTRSDECFGVFTPYGEEKHISNYMSIFGRDFEPDETASAYSRLIVLPDSTTEDILALADEFLQV